MTDHKMKKHTKIALAGLGAVVLIGGIAAASDHVLAGSWDHGGKYGGKFGHYKADVFDRFDADGDGRVTIAEIDGFKAALIERHNADRSGSINLDEFAAVWLEQTRPMMVDGFQRLDDDGSGDVTVAEIDRKFDRMVRHLDRNGDGAIAMKELGRHGHHGHYDDDDDDDDDEKS